MVSGTSVGRPEPAAFASAGQRPVTCGHSATSAVTRSAGRGSACARVVNRVLELTLATLAALAPGDVEGERGDVPTTKPAKSPTIVCLIGFAWFSSAGAALCVLVEVTRLSEDSRVVSF